MAVWTALEKLIEEGARIRDSPITGRVAIGAFFGVLLGTLPLTLLTSGGSFSPSIWISAAVGGLVGHFYHRGYMEAEKYWRKRHSFEQEMIEEVKRREQLK